MAYLTGSADKIAIGEMKNELEVDLVYMWVDGNDPVWQAKKRAVTGEDAPVDAEQDGNARYIEHDELKYSLRSAEKYAPWIRWIFIVTDNQVPSWLDTSDPKIRIVDHTEIFPPEALPCFNSSVIEYFLYRIPGLSEHFLLANDDTFFNAPVTPDFFFASDGYPIVMLRRKPFGNLRLWYKRRRGITIGNYRKMLLQMACAVKEATGKFYSGVPHHNIDAYNKSDYRRAVEEVFAPEIVRCQANHTRTKDDFHRSAIGLWAIAVKHAHRRYVARTDSDHISIHRPDLMGQYKRKPCVLMCVSDSELATDKDRESIRPFLESLFPGKSRFEK